MSKCRYDLSEDCNNTDCLNCVLGKIRAEIMQVVAEEKTEDSRWALGLKYSIKIINKYKAAEREQIPDIKVTAEEAAEAIQNLTKAGISQEDIESIDRPFYDADTRRIRILPPENIQKLKGRPEWLPQYEGEWVAESEESMIRSRQMANKLSQNIIEHARRLYPEAIGYKGQLTNEQFCEIEKECDIDFYKFGRQDTIYKIRYKGGR